MIAYCYFRNCLQAGEYEDGWFTYEREGKERTIATTAPDEDGYVWPQ